MIVDCKHNLIVSLTEYQFYKHLCAEILNVLKAFIQDFKWQSHSTTV